MTYWQVAIGLSCIAAVFILWPLLGHWLRNDERKVAEERTETNTRLYQEHVAELQQLLNNGDIDEEEFATLQLEQQRALLEDVIDSRSARYKRDGLVLLVAAALLVPVAGWVIYQQLGAKDDWHIHQLVEAWQSDDKQGVEVEQELRTELSRRVKQQPNNTQNWYLLATLAMNVQDYDQAVEAFRQLLKLEPDSPQIIAELAQAQFLQAGNRVTAEVRHNTWAALELEPDMPTALGLAGIDAFQQGYFQKAIDHWSRAVELLGANSPGAQSLVSGIERAKAELEARGEIATRVDERQDGKSDSGVHVTVSLAEDISVPPAAIVYVYVRAFEGPPMPLAIQRFKADELPKSLVLNDSSAMMPSMSMSKFERLEVVARISQSGDAVPQSGDWQVIQGPVTASDEGTEVALVISEQIP